MAEPTIQDALKLTLQDHRLSRGEKRALSKVIEKYATDTQSLAHARSIAFDLARRELRDDGMSGTHFALEILDWLEEAIKVLSVHTTSDSRPRSEAFFSPHDNCASKIVRLFQQARSSVDVCVFTITDDRIKEAMLSAHHRGVKLRIISDNEKSHDLGSDIHQLEDSGISVRCDRSDYHMHHKFALFDRTTVITGSYNWTRSAANFNEENLIVTDEHELAHKFLRAFENLWLKLK